MVFPFKIREKVRQNNASLCLKGTSKYIDFRRKTKGELYKILAFSNAKWAKEGGGERGQINKVSLKSCQANGKS